jgi:hypothetical protein
MGRAKSILILALAVTVGAAAGVVSTIESSGFFLRHVEDTRQIADATIYSTVLEKLRTGDATGAASIVKSQLSAAMIGLQADRDQLSPMQRQQLNAIQDRITELEISPRASSK